MNKHLLVIGLFFLLLGGCDKKSSTVSVSQVSKYYHNDNITSNETWSADMPHIVETEICIQQAILTIEAGAVIKFKEGAAINVMESAGLIANGSSEAPISFTYDEGQQKLWKCIYFSSGAVEDNCILINCKFDYGGGDENSPAIIYCQELSPTITNCEIKNSASNGVILAGNCSSTQFKNNSITLNTASPIITAACNVPAIGKSDYVGNNVDCIRIVEGTITKDAEWPNFNIPYHIADDLNINNAKLTISAGTEIMFEPRKGMSITNNGELIANGKEEQIVFTATESAAGSWNCLYFGTSSHGQLENCVIEKGGSNSQFPANIVIEQSSINITNCLIKNSSGYGIYIKEEYAPKSFYNNTITTNRGAPISTPAINVPNLAENNLAGNGENFIEVRGGYLEGELDKTSYWENLGLPYRVTDNLTVRSATLHIAAGVILEMSYASNIEIMEGGQLIADGSSHLITFTAVHKFPGSWNCIYFSNFSNSTNCLLKNCRIEYGGGDFNRPANIYLENASPVVANCYIENSLNYGIYLAGGSNSDLENNYFYNNLSGSIYSKP